MAKFPPLQRAQGWGTLCGGGVKEIGVDWPRVPRAKVDDCVKTIALK